MHTAFERLCTTQPAVNGDWKPYVFAAVRNAAIDLRRVGQRGKHIQESIFNGYAPLPGVSSSPPDELLTAERDQILRHAVAALKDDDREIVVLKAFAELTFGDIAEVMDMPAKTIATRYRRALTTLEQRLRGQL